MNLQKQRFAAEKIMQSAYIKILTNYSQTIAIFNTLQLNWDDRITNFFNVLKTSSCDIHHLIAFECIYGLFFYQ